MKKMIVKIKDINWYKSNCNDDGQVFPENAKDTDFFSRGQAEFCGQLAEVTSVDNDENYRLNIDKGAWLWKEWQFSKIEEKEVNENIIEAEYHAATEEELKIMKEKMVSPIIETFNDDIKEDKNTVEFKAKVINYVNEWRLSFNLGLVVINTIFADRSNIENYKNLLNISILCLKNELNEIEKEKV